MKDWITFWVIKIWVGLQYKKKIILTCTLQILKEKLDIKFIYLLNHQIFHNNIGPWNIHLNQWR